MLFKIFPQSVCKCYNDNDSVPLTSDAAKTEFLRMLSKQPTYGCVFFEVKVREKEREMFYLTTHSTHFIYGYMASDMVKDHSDSEKGNPLPPHRLLLSINSKGSFICTIPQTAK